MTLCEGYTDYDKITCGGFVAGGTVGLNYQFPTSNFVLGFEGDFDWSNIRGSLSEGYTEGDYGEGYSESTELDWLATARARIGYAVTTPFGNLLPYVTGGAAFGSVKDFITSGNLREILKVKAGRIPGPAGPPVPASNMRSRRT